MGQVFRFDPRRSRSRRAWHATFVAGPRNAGKAALCLRRRATRLALRLGVGMAAVLPAMAAVWVAGTERVAYAASELLPLDSERVTARFDRCDARRGGHCVVDGDTIRISERRIRLVGFDAPEKDARCQAERLGAERATAALQTWLNRGPFEMTVAFGTARIDRYGRDLREALRGEGVRIEELARYMVGSGFAREYGGGSRGAWC